MCAYHNSQSRAGKQSRSCMLMQMKVIALQGSYCCASLWYCVQPASGESPGAQCKFSAQAGCSWKFRYNWNLICEGCALYKMTWMLDFNCGDESFHFQASARILQFCKMVGIYVIACLCALWVNPLFSNSAQFYLKVPKMLYKPLFME